MTPQSFQLEMAFLYGEGYDKEYAHQQADELMCKLLKELGYEEGVRIFEESERWYA